MIKALTTSMLALLITIPLAQADAVKRYTNPVLGFSLNYGTETHITETPNKALVTIANRIRVGNTVQNGIGVGFKMKNTMGKSFKEFVDEERAYFASDQQQVRERVLTIDEKYHAVEITRIGTSNNKDILYLMIQLPNKNDVLTMSMITDNNPSSAQLKERNEKGQQLYLEIVNGLDIH